jgi:hypothetical protein
MGITIRSAAKRSAEFLVGLGERYRLHISQKPRRDLLQGDRFLREIRGRNDRIPGCIGDGIGQSLLRHQSQPGQHGIQPLAGFLLNQPGARERLGAHEAPLDDKLIQPLMPVHYATAPSKTYVGEWLNSPRLAAWLRPRFP